VRWLCLLKYWYSEADLFRKYFKPRLTRKTSAVVKGVRGWRQDHFTTDSMHVRDQSSVRTSRAAADQWCWPSVTVPRCRWPVASLTDRHGTTRHWPEASIERPPRVVTDQGRRPNVNHLSSSLTSAVDDHVLLSRTSVGVDHVLLLRTSVVDDHVLLSLTGVGVDDHALRYLAVVDDVRWRWPTMMKDDDGGWWWPPTLTIADAYR